MSTQQQVELAPIKLGWSSAPIRIIIGVVLAAIIPLILILGFTLVFTRPALVDSADQAMKTNAQNRQQLIDNYIGERVGDVQTLAQIETVLNYYAEYNTLQAKNMKMSPMDVNLVHARIALQAGVLKDRDYVRWTLFNKAGSVILSYPDNPQPHGQYMVPPGELQQVTQGQAVVSPVYASADHKTATIDIYVPVMLEPPEVQQQVFLGFARSTLKLDYIWNSVVGKDLGANGSGSYAFVLDDNGVRIADTGPVRRFQGVETINSDEARTIAQEERYGTQNPTQVVADLPIANSLHNGTSSDIFQDQPAGSNETDQIVRQTTANQYVQWNYFVVSPMSTVTAVANQELVNIMGVAIVDSLILALIGLIVWRGFARPILQSVEKLRKGSLALNTLATHQRDASSEQMWVVDSSQGGLQSVQYYTDAFKVAVHELQEAVNGLTQSWQQGGDPQQMQQALERILAATSYLDNAAQYQNVSNQKLATALNVATLATDQLHDGATSAAEAAEQLEQVMNQLMGMLGKSQ